MKWCHEQVVIWLFAKYISKTRVNAHLSVSQHTSRKSHTSQIRNYPHTDRIPYFKSERAVKSFCVLLPYLGLCVVWLY